MYFFIYGFDGDMYLDRYKTAFFKWLGISEAIESAIKFVSKFGPVHWQLENC
jgi:hypothetical protein